MLIYGQPSAGKTLLAATANHSALTSPVVFGDFEDGTLTLHDQHILIRDVPDLATFNDFMRDLAGDTEFRTVVFDSLNAIHRMFMQDEITKQAKEDMRSVYGNASTRIIEFLIKTRRLNKHTIFTAWADEDKEEKSNRATNIAPALPGKLSVLLPGYVDFVFHLGVEPRQGVTQRVLRTGMDGARLAKDRTHLLPKELINPTFPQIVEIVAPALAGGKASSAKE